VDRIITITETKEINISAIERQRDEFIEQANSIMLVDIPNGLSEEVEDILTEKNSELELVKADLLDQANTLNEEVKSYG